MLSKRCGGLINVLWPELLYEAYPEFGKGRVSLADMILTLALRVFILRKVRS